MPYEYWLLGLQSSPPGGAGTAGDPHPVHGINDMLEVCRLHDAELRRRRSPGDIDQIDNDVLFQTLAAVYPEEDLAMFHRSPMDQRSRRSHLHPLCRQVGAEPRVSYLLHVKTASLPGLADSVDNIRAENGSISGSMRSTPMSRWAATRGRWREKRPLRATRSSTPDRRWISMCRRRPTKARSEAAVSRFPA